MYVCRCKVNLKISKLKYTNGSNYKEITKAHQRCRNQTISNHHLTQPFIQWEGVRMLKSAAENDAILTEDKQQKKKNTRSCKLNIYGSETKIVPRFRSLRFYIPHIFMFHISQVIWRTKKRSHLGQGQDTSVKIGINRPNRTWGGEGSVTRVFTNEGRRRWHLSVAEGSNLSISLSFMGVGWARVFFI